MEYFLVALIFGAAGLIQGFSGFGAALIAIPLMALFLDIKIAVPLSILNGLLITVLLTLKLKNYIDKTKIIPLSLGCVPGVFIGVGILKRADENLLKLTMGILIIIYATYNLFIKKNKRKISIEWGYVSGFLSGIAGGSFGMGGPPAIIYASLTGWSKEEIKATLSAYFFLIGTGVTLVYGYKGLLSAEVWKYFAYSFAFASAGVCIGSFFYERIGRRVYLKTVNILLIAMGGIMVKSALLSFG